MLKVLIADDEVKVCRLIKMLVPWNDLGLEIVDVVHNGVDALKIIEQKKPDIAITDIRMPGLDGIALIEQVREISPATQFVIISGYRRFDYAYSALKYGIENYLLKPINQEQLVDSLKNLILKIKKSHDINEIESGKFGAENLDFHDNGGIYRLTESDSGIVKAEKNIENPALNMQKLYPLLKSNSLEVGRGLDAFNQVYKLDFASPFCQVLLIKFDIAEDLQTLTQLEEKNNLLAKVDKSIRQHLNDKCHQIIVEYYNDLLFVLLNPEIPLDTVQAGSLKDNLQQSLCNWFKNAQSIVREYRIVKMTVGVGGLKQQLSHMPESYNKAQAAVDHRIYDDMAGRFIEETDYEYIYLDKKDLLTANRIKTLQNTIEVFDCAGLANWICGLKSDIMSHRYLPPVIIIEIAYEIGNIAGKAFFNISKKEDKSIFSIDTYQGRIQNSSSIDSLFDQIQKTLSEAMNYLYVGLKKEIVRPVREAKIYITNHFMLPLTLEEVAGQVNLNSAYFSTLFKNETGTTFSEFLQTTRMEVAKELLKTSNKKIGEIAASVGYQDAKYFSKIFIKEMGIKPSEYRKLYSYL